MKVVRIASQHVPIEKIIAAYEQTGSVWKAGTVVGLSGQAVHSRLQKHGYKTGNPFTDDERDTIRSYYTTTPASDFDLNKISDLVGRPRSSVCNIAKEMGLTVQGRRSDKHLERLRAASVGKWDRNPHPRGYLGHSHSEETRIALSENSKSSWERMKRDKTGNMSPENLQALSDRTSLRMASADPSKIYSRAAAGYREDLGETYFRSSWEANYARYLNWLLEKGEILSWEYEPETFWFDKIKRGVRSYKPDFRITEKNGKVHYDEIKGFMDAKSKTKIKRMRIYYPGVDLRVIEKSAYYAIAKVMAPLLKNWETKPSNPKRKGNEI